MAESLALLEIWRRRLDRYRRLMGTVRSPADLRFGASSAAPYEYKADLRALREAPTPELDGCVPPPSRSREVLVPQTLAGWGGDEEDG